MINELLHFKIAGKKIPVDVKTINNKLELRFNYSTQDYFAKFLDEIKNMESVNWVPAKKCWTIGYTPRNLWTIDFLTGNDPYKKYDKPLLDVEFQRSLFNHQQDMARHGLTFRQVLWAVEMRCGKTLSAIEVMERSEIEINDDNALWIAPRSALAGVQLEFRKWGFKGRPRMLTYEGLKKVIEIWPSGKPAPQIVVFDEISRVKTPTSQRSVAAKHLADQMRLENPDCYIIGMSGTPAPKSPADWWHLAEIACPGFLKEGNIFKFRNRLGLIQQKESPSGGVYPELVTWWDDENKCSKCGKLKDEGDHTTSAKYNYHPFKSSKNEIAYLFERMRGLVVVKFKKDCLDLPPKQYQIIQCTPSRAIENAAKIIVSKSKRVISAMILCRQLSDGFQYKETENGTMTCPLCHGTGEANLELNPYDATTGNSNILDKEVTNDQYDTLDFLDIDYDVDIVQNGQCPHCKGNRVVPRYERETIEIESPKIDIVKDLLDQHEDVGRIVFYAGFHGSIDRLAKTCLKEGWEYIQVDGRGWKSSIPLLKTDQDKLFAFANQQNIFPKIAYIGHPGSGGMGIDLAASPTICFYSNDFVGESRFQAEERAHGPMMDKNRGCTIIDLVCLPTDNVVLDNLMKKRKLQDLTMGEFQNSLKYYDETRRQ